MGPGATPWRFSAASTYVAFVRVMRAAIVLALPSSVKVAKYFATFFPRPGACLWRSFASRSRSGSREAFGDGEAQDDPEDQEGVQGATSAGQIVIVEARKGSNTSRGEAVKAPALTPPIPRRSPGTDPAPFAGRRRSLGPARRARAGRRCLPGSCPEARRCRGSPCRA